MTCSNDKCEDGRVACEHLNDDRVCSVVPPAGEPIECPPGADENCTVPALVAGTWCFMTPTAPCLGAGA